MALTSEIKSYMTRFQLRRACSIFGVKNKNGVFIGRNYDWLPIAENIFETFIQKPYKKYTYIALSDMFIGKESDVINNFLLYDHIDAINEKGLFIGITFAYHKSWQFGLGFNEVIRLISEACSNIEEAVSIFREIPISVPKNFFIADKNGKMIVIEHTAKRFKEIFPKDNIIIQTNHFTDCELEEEDGVLSEEPAHNTYLRYYEILQKLNSDKNNIRLKDIKTILRNPKSYTFQNNKTIKTIWTLALDVVARKYYLYTDTFKGKKSLVLDNAL